MATVRIGDSEEYEFDFGNPENQEVMLLERLFDGTFGEWSDALSKGSIKALTAFVTTLRRRYTPTTKMGDVSFNIRDIKFEGLKAGDDEDSEEESNAAGPTETPSRSEEARA